VPGCRPICKHGNHSTLWPFLSRYKFSSALEYHQTIKERVSLIVWSIIAFQSVYARHSRFTGNKAHSTRAQPELSLRRRHILYQEEKCAKQLCTYHKWPFMATITIYFISLMLGLIATFQIKRRDVLHVADNTFPGLGALEIILEDA
jgi:hypothetical protein